MDFVSRSLFSWWSPAHQCAELILTLYQTYGHTYNLDAMDSLYFSSILSIIRLFVELVVYIKTTALPSFHSLTVYFSYRYFIISDVFLVLLYNVVLITRSYIVFNHSKQKWNTESSRKSSRIGFTPFWVSELGKMDASIYQRLHPHTYLQRFLERGLRTDGRKEDSWRSVGINVGEPWNLVQTTLSTKC